jgi:hypothetical protein
MILTNTKRTRKVRRSIFKNFLIDADGLWAQKYTSYNRIDDKSIIASGRQVEAERGV